MTFPEILRKLRTDRNLTTDSIAENIGVSVAAYRYYERGERQPTIDTLCKLADFYKVSTDYLLGRTAVKNMADADIYELLGITEQAKNTDTDSFMEVFGQLSEGLQKAFYQVMIEMSKLNGDNTEGEEDEPIIKTFLFNDLPASAGTGYELDTDSNVEEREFIVPDDDTDGDFVIRIQGDSMEPDYPDGSCVLIKKYADGVMEAGIGDIALFRCCFDEDCVDAFGYVKKYVGNGVLRSLNPKYDDIQPRSVEPVGKIAAIVDMC